MFKVGKTRFLPDTKQSTPVLFIGHCCFGLINTDLVNHSVEQYALYQQDL